MREGLVVLALVAGCGDGAKQVPADGPTASDGADARSAVVFTATPAELVFNTLVGTTARQSVVFTSSGPSGALALALGGTAPAPFAIETTTCTGALAAGETCTAQIAFTPPAASTATALLTLSDGEASLVVPLAGTGSNTAGLSATPTLRDFGTVGTGSTSSSFSFTVKNVGTVTTSALGVTFDSGASGDFALANDLCAGAMLAAQATCTFSAAFSPTTIGPRTATLKVRDATSGAQVGITLTGQGTSPPAGLVFAPTMFDFGTVNVGDSAFGHQFTLTNTSGATTGAIAISRGGTNAGDFLVMADNCTGRTLLAGGQCSLFVSFEPGAAGGRLAEVTATATPGGAATTNVTGTGQ